MQYSTSSFSTLQIPGRFECRKSIDECEYPAVYGCSCLALLFRNSATLLWVDEGEASIRETKFER